MLLEALDATSAPAQPFMRRCYDSANVAGAPPWLLRLGSGQSLHDNGNLTAGRAQGALFAQPGGYLVTPELVLPLAVGSAQGLRLRGTRDRGRSGPESGHGTNALATNEVALVIGLGGTAGLGPLEDAFQEVPNRPANAGPGTNRVQAVRARIDGLSRFRNGDCEQAAELLEQSVDLADGRSTRRPSSRHSGWHAGAPCRPSGSARSESDDRPSWRWAPATQ